MFMLQSAVVLHDHECFTSVGLDSSVDSSFWHYPMYTALRGAEIGARVLSVSRVRFTLHFTQTAPDLVYLPLPPPVYPTTLSPPG